MTLFYAEGPEHRRRACARLGFEVFVDLKLHDIPHQVAGAAAAIARLGAGMFTVHASGGSAMMRAAVESSRRAAEEVGLHAPAVLAVTVLTSTDDAGLAEIGVAARACRAGRACLPGSRARPASTAWSARRSEAAGMREPRRRGALVVTPGVRPLGGGRTTRRASRRQRRRLQAGASHLVIGRPITAAADPAAGCRPDPQSRSKEIGR